MALDPRVVLLIGAETGVLDESSYARTLTAVGNAARTTAQFKYGVGSLTFDGTGDRVTAADSNDWSFGAGDFTVEGWFRFLVKTNNQALVTQWGTVPAANGFALYITGGALWFFTTVSADVSFTWVPTLGQWYHIAADRSGTTLRLYIDGAVVATNASASGTLNNSTQALALGALGVTDAFPTFDFNGQMDEIRITTGLAQYAGAFTPPTGPFPRDTPAAAARVTQVAIETLSLPVPAGRVSQVAVEVLSATTPVPARVTQVAIEVLSANPAVGGGERIQMYVWGPL